ncbi:C40 family peptidase [Chitinasiproducens palmae]|uniref:Cell wall-associated hydrolase, NlpC family n=1 Tax=Chitinasiproducens palmae TaxID=1770053 RepID=A0A1H2PN39_9BURK|nr:C40 family peptidase [Chitinasiproducens palmae]SDV47573.1 Cell wall-associated hydrolase, NlpC family [Chitinasiproducens palmae]
MQQRLVRSSFRLFASFLAASTLVCAAGTAQADETNGPFQAATRTSGILSPSALNAAPIIGSVRAADMSQDGDQGVAARHASLGPSGFLSGVASKAGDVVVGALNLIGVRYQWGGNTPDAGLDCSGFVKYVFQDTLNYELPRRAEEMSRVGEKIRPDELKAGDLVFFKTMRRAFSHVGIYIGDNKFVHSPSTGSTIRVDNLSDRYWSVRYNGARRIDDAVYTDDVAQGNDVRAHIQRAKMSY